MTTSELFDEAAAEMERLESQLAEAREIITLIPAVAFHSPFCRSREPGFLFECDCGLSDVLQMAQEWQEAQS